MKEKMAKAGYAQGDMSPKVEDYQRPGSVYSQEGFNKTTEYIERHNKYETKEASEIKKQAYQGRYS
jgi:hypothetical protein